MIECDDNEICERLADLYAAVVAAVEAQSATKADPQSESKYEEWASCQQAIESMLDNLIEYVEECQSKAERS